MKHFFKEHFVLLVGASLPLLLSLIFFIAAHPVPIKNPPRTPIVYDNFSCGDYDFTVEKDGTLTLYYTFDKALYEETQEHPCRAKDLYIFDPVTKTTEKLKIPVFNKDKSSTVTIPYKRKFSDNEISPDGWRFGTSNHYGNQNLMTELFGGHQSDYKTMLTKDTYKVTVSDKCCPAVRFIAWVLPEKSP